MGKTLYYTTTDLTNQQEMKVLIQQVEIQWNQSIEGVFHLAGITTENITLDKMTDTLLQKVLSAKVQGAYVLHQLFKHSQLNCFVLFSSTSAIPYFGIGGLSAYAMANEFLDGLALLRQQQNLPAISINWTAWADKGMSFKHNHSVFLKELGVETLSLTDGIKILKALLALKLTSVSVVKIDWQRFFRMNKEFKYLTFFNAFVSNDMLEKTPTVINHVLSENDLTQKITLILSTLLELTVNEIDINTPFQNYGMDSILGIHFVDKINEISHEILSPMDIFRYPSIQKLVNYILQKAHSTIDSTTTNQTEEQFLNDIDDLSDDDIKKLIEDELSL